MAAQFFHGLIELRLGRDAVMPTDLVFHVRNALALDGMGDHAQRFCPIGARRKRIEERRRVVTVDVDHVPTKGAKLVGERLDVISLGDPRALLQAYFCR